MTPTVMLCVALGAAVGAPLRFLAERRLAASWPWGTWIVNVIGSAILGLLMGAVAVRGSGSTVALVALVGTGFCGALTTFGGFAAQALDLAVAPLDAAVSGRALRSVGYGLVSVLGCIAVAGLGYVTASSFTGG